MPRRKEPFELVGVFHLRKWDEHGNLTNEVIKKNLVVNVGKNICRDRIGDPSTALPAANWIGIGTGTTAPASSDTNLVGLINRQSGVFTALGVGSWKIVSTWGAGNPSATSVAISESGVFCGNAATMLSRVTFAVVNKASSDTISITWGFTIS